MYFGIGFFTAALSVLIVVPVVHGRAVRLTTRQLEEALPSSMAEVIADKDLQRAEFAMSMRRLEIDLEQLKTKGANQLAELGRKAAAINRLKIELGALRDQLRTSEEDSASKANAASEAQCALTDKESELAKLTGTLEDHTVLTDSQKAEIAALTRQVQTLKERLAWAGDEARAAEGRRDAQRLDLKAATYQLAEERTKFYNFHGRVAELVAQVVTQTTEDKNLARRTQEDLESRLIEQSRLLNQSERELKHLRGEIEIAQKAEYDLRVAISEIDGRANAAVRNFEAENARLQVMLDRANGERARLAHELANIKRQVKDAQAA